MVCRTCAAFRTHVVGLRFRIFLKRLPFQIYFEALEWRYKVLTKRRLHLESIDLRGLSGCSTWFFILGAPPNFDLKIDPLSSMRSEQDLWPNTAHCLLPDNYENSFFRVSSDAVLLLPISAVWVALLVVVIVLLSWSSQWFLVLCRPTPTFSDRSVFCCSSQVLCLEVIPWNHWKFTSVLHNKEGCQSHCGVSPISELPSVRISKEPMQSGPQERERSLCCVLFLDLLKVLPMSSLSGFQQLCDFPILPMLLTFCLWGWPWGHASSGAWGWSPQPYPAHQTAQCQWHPWSWGIPRRWRPNNLDTQVWDLAPTQMTFPMEVLVVTGCLH